MKPATATATATAIREHRRCTAQLGPLRRALAKRHLLPQTLADLNRRLDELAAALSDVEQSEVAVQDRKRVIKLIMGVYPAMNAIWKDALAAEEEAKRQEEADEQERLRREQEEKNKLPEDFAGKAGSFGKAKSLATAATAETFTNADFCVVISLRENPR